MKTFQEYNSKLSQMRRLYVWRLFAIILLLSAIVVKSSGQCSPSALQTVTVSPGSSGAPTVFEWSDNCYSVGNYEIQILRLFNTSPAKLTASEIIAKVDWDEALTFCTNVGLKSPATSFSFYMTLAEGTGYYVWRVRRMHGWGYKGDADNESWGAWTSTGSFTQGATLTVNSGSLSSYCFFYDQFDNDKNWIYRRSFGEGEPNHAQRTRITEKINYANNLLMPEQEQEISQWWGDKIVSQTINDYNGRPSFKTLPVNDAGWLGHMSDLVKNQSGQLYTAEDYDRSYNFFDPLHVTGAVENYYSNSNPDSRIPISKGRPFGRTLYYNDNLNRPREIVSPGDAHAFGSGHTILKYYGKPTTSELVRLFGDEAPKAESVLKTYTKDPNGVFNVTYTDELDRTIATCLTTPKSTLLEPLNDTTRVNRDTVKEKTLIDPRRLLSKATYVFAVPTALQYLYKIVPKTYGDQCQDLCATCDYKITLTAKERDSDYTYRYFWDVVPVIDSVTGACTSVTTLDSAYYEVPNVLLEPGTYDVSLVLEIKNSVPTDSEKLYIDHMVEILHRKLDASFNSGLGKVLPSTVANKSLATMKSYLAAGDITGLITYVGADTSKPYFYMVFNNNCDTLKLPTARCKQPECASPKFAAYMKDEMKKYDQQSGTSFFANAYANTTSGGVAFTTSSANLFLVATDAELDTIIRNMANDGYTCAELWDAWVKTVQTYINGQRAILPSTVTQLVSGSEKYDWWSKFMDNVGYKHALQQASASQLGTASSLVTTKPYRYFPYNWGTFTNLEDAYCYLAGTSTPAGNPPNWLSTISNFPSSPSGNLFHMHNFYKGVKKLSNGTANTAFINTSVLGGALNPSNSNSLQAAGIMQHECEMMCEQRLDGFMSEIANDFMDFQNKVEGYTYDAWRPVKLDSVPIQQVFCLANSLLVHCKDQCDMAADSSGYISNAKLSKVKFSSFYTMEIDARPNSILNNCQFGWDSVGIQSTSSHRTLLAWLNWKKKQLQTHYANIGSIGANWSLFSEIPSMTNSNCQTSVFVSPADPQGYFAFGRSKTDSNAACSTGSVRLYRNCLDTVMTSEWIKVKTFAVLNTNLLAGDSLVFIDTIPAGTWARSWWGKQDTGPVIRYSFTGPRNAGDTITYWYQLVAPAIQQVTHLSGKVTHYVSGAPSSSCSVLNQPLVISNCVGLYYYSFVGNPTEPSRIRVCDNICVNNSLVCNGEVCIRWRPILDAPEGVPNDSTFKARTCAEIMCQGFEDALNYQIDKIHYEREAKMRADYSWKCLNRYNIEDLFVNSFEQTQYQYTLYYYDRAGNLIRTVSPNGVTDTTSARLYNPQHEFASKYEYTSLGQVVKQETPDGGVTNFTYDKKGRLRFSQNAKQAVKGSYSYTRYDELNRVVEVGEATVPDAGFGSMDPDDPNVPAASDCGFVTRTTYTLPYAGSELPTGGGSLPLGEYQQFLMNRVSYVQTDVNGNFAHKNDQTLTVYSYDPHGNVEFLYQWIAGMQKPRLLRYEYDVIAGKPYKVELLNIDTTKDPADYFYMTFAYDGDSRLKNSGFGCDPAITRSATDYLYNRHDKSQLRRLGIGYLMQGIDYTYTIEGWLKAINHTKSDLDPGSDYNYPFVWGPDGGPGCPPPCFPGASLFYKDAYAEVLYYYDGDFDRVNSPFNHNQFGFNVTAANLYNGNISARQEVVNAPPVSGNKFEEPVAYTYRYDELNRLVKSEFTPWSSGPQAFDPPTVNDHFSEYFSYDKNGNLTSLQRYADLGTDLLDNLGYTYIPGTNKLDVVTDTANPTGYEGVKNGTSQFYHDQAGNMVSDQLEGLTVTWTPYGKVETMNDTFNWTSTRFRYDGQGNRALKSYFTGNSFTSILEYRDFYIRDAVGNVVAVYRDDVNKGTYEVSERYLYGADRIGVIRGINDYSGMTIKRLGPVEYEIKDHLGNVRAMVADTIDGYSAPSWPDAEIKSSFNYYAFGGLQPDRQYNPLNNKYGFNGKENDNEVLSLGKAVDFGSRIYYSGLGRFTSLDPLQRKYPSVSAYTFVADNPIIHVDLDGRDLVYFNMLGNELYRIKSDKVFKTFVQTGETNFENFLVGNYTFSEAPMPKIIQYKVKQNTTGSIYQRYDYNIAAETFIFNYKKNHGITPAYTNGRFINDPSTVPDLDPTMVKAMIMQESGMGTEDPDLDDPNNSYEDIMQANVWYHEGKDGNDWADSKKQFGLVRKGGATPVQSIRAGIGILYQKGLRTEGGTTIWKGGGAWDDAAMKYNAKGAENYENVLNMRNNAEQGVPANYNSPTGINRNPYEK